MLYCMYVLPKITIQKQRQISIAKAIGSFDSLISLDRLLDVGSRSIQFPDSGLRVRAKERHEGIHVQHKRPRRDRSGQTWRHEQGNSLSLSNGMAVQEGTKVRQIDHLPVGLQAALLHPGKGFLLAQTE